MKAVFCIFNFVIGIHYISLGQNMYDTLRTVKMTALANDQVPNLTIQWKDDPGVNTYRLYKKLWQDTSWGDPLIITGDRDTNYLDAEVEEGTLYEYRIVKETGDSLGYAYLFSGVNYVPLQKKGDLLILIDSIAAGFVHDNLIAYRELLVSEGWLPWLVTIPQTASVQEVKSLILQYYASLDSLTTILLLGNIAVPHSGNINPDGHTDHKGAWPADLYYGDVDGIWTDQTVHNISSAYPRLHNIPGDGNFDQDYIPGSIELAIGRIDFSELPVFTLNQYELLNRYLEKNIAYRTGEYQVKRRAVIKNRNPWTEGLAQNGIRNFVPLVSADSIVYVDFFDAFYDSFLWSYGGSSGSMISSLGLGNINTYANNNFQAVFTAYFGSYYGDYDFENNYLRTVLGSGKVLSTAWVGAPNWYFHPMGMGLDLGFCTLLTQNNIDQYYAGFFPQAITINLLGDPTLKAFIVRQPHDLQGLQTGNQITLSWSPVEDSILGYQVYRKYPDMDYFEPVNLLPVLNTVLSDTCVRGETIIQYLVKAVKREITPSGSFLNYSSGPIISMQTQPAVLPHADFDLSWEEDLLKAINLSTDAEQYRWILPDGTSIFGDSLAVPYAPVGEIPVTLIASNFCFSDTLQQVLEITDAHYGTIQKEYKIYPNPTQDFFTLETNLHVDELRMYNILGRSVMAEFNLGPGTHTINIQDFPEGNYLIKIRTGNQVIPKMLILSR